MQEEVAALGHTKEVLEAVAATCTNSGVSDGEYCTSCETVVVEQEIILALGHTKEVLEAVAPTCTGTGLTAGEKCSACG